MEKRNALWTVGLVWVLLSVITAPSTATNTVYFDPNPSIIAPGNTTTVTLWLDTSDGVATFNTWVHFNSSVVNITNGAAGDFPTDFGFSHFEDYVRIAGDSSEKTGTLKLADLTVKAVSPGTSALWYSNNRLYNQSNMPVSATWMNGTVTCGCLGTCCFYENGEVTSVNEDYATEITYQDCEPNWTCQQCKYMDGLWTPNKDAACFGDYTPFDVTLNLSVDYCPQCCNDIDDDSDTNFDFPADEQCTCGLDPSETTPSAPVPELPPIALFSLGLLALTGYVLQQKRA
jgi:hypothetical protein